MFDINLIKGIFGDQVWIQDDTEMQTEQRDDFNFEMDKGEDCKHKRQNSTQHSIQDVDENVGANEINSKINVQPLTGVVLMTARSQTPIMRHET